MVNGKPVETAIACSAPSPPPSSSAMATSALERAPEHALRHRRVDLAAGGDRVDHQRAGVRRGDEEHDHQHDADERGDRLPAAALPAWRTASVPAASINGLSRPSVTIWLIAVPPKRHPQTQTSDGMISTQMMNSRTVRPAADAGDEHADEGRPGDPPRPVERRPALAEIVVLAAERDSTAGRYAGVGERLP
jgi:hypothetical protein